MLNSCVSIYMFQINYKGDVGIGIAMLPTFFDVLPGSDDGLRSSSRWWVYAESFDRIFKNDQ